MIAGIRLHRCECERDRLWPGTPRRFRWPPCGQVDAWCDLPSISLLLTDRDRAIAPRAVTCVTNNELDPPLSVMRHVLSLLK